MNFLKDLIDAYKFALEDLSKTYPMPFEHYKGGQKINVNELYIDRRGFYIGQDEKVPPRAFMEEIEASK